MSQCEQACDGQMMTPLHMACTHGSDTIAAMLIQKHSQLRATDEELGTPLHAACTEGHLDIVKLLFEAGEGQGLLEQVNQYITLCHPPPLTHTYNVHVGAPGNLFLKICYQGQVTN